MSIFQRSSSGSPSTIQLATWRPIPPAPAIPWAENPAATKNPRDLGLAEDELVVRREPSGPLMIRVTPASAIAGTRRTAPAMISSNRGQSGARSLPLKSAGTPSSDHGAGLRS